jgi:hypothetical protein
VVFAPQYCHTLWRNGQFWQSLYGDPGDAIGISGKNFTLEVSHGYVLYTDKVGSLSWRWRFFPPTPAQWSLDAKGLEPCHHPIALP